MADTLPAPSTPRKLFKPSSKIKTPTPVKRPRAPTTTESSQPAQAATDTAQDETNYQLAGDGPAGPKQETPAAGIADSTLLAPLTNVSASAASDTTGGLLDTVLTPSDTASRTSQAKESGNDPVGGLVGAISEAPKGALESVSDSLPIGSDDSAITDKSPADIVNYFREHGNPEMGEFVQSLIGEESASTPKATQSPRDTTPTPRRRTPLDASDRENNKNNNKDNNKMESDKKQTIANAPEPGDVSKAADGTFRAAEGDQAEIKSAGKMGQPDVSEISKTAKPAVPRKSPENKGEDEAQVADNMGRPAHVERSIEIPLQRPAKGDNHQSRPENTKTGQDLSEIGDFEELPSTDNLRSTDDLPDLPGEDSQDPPEEMLDPSVHSASANISPIPKIPKIEHISSPPPMDLPLRVKGLAGYIVDDVGNVVDESGKVLGHATGDLPEMIGKKVSETGEIYGDAGEIIGYVSENFVNPPPRPIPAHVLGSLKVDHEGNILDSEGNIIGKFHQKPGPDGAIPGLSSPSASPKVESQREKPQEKAKSMEEPKPKINAQTGGSPSDLFLDVKSTNDGIQLTIRIPTIFSQPPKE